jgi:hypothetical protein
MGVSARPSQSGQFTGNHSFGKKRKISQNIIPNGKIVVLLPPFLRDFQKSKLFHYYQVRNGRENRKS